jgi:hypothetical protein
MANTMTLISSVTVGSGGTSTMTFSSIPSTYTDLCLKLSLRSSSANDRRIIFFKFNGVVSGYNDKSIRAYSGGVASQTDNGGNTSFAVWDMPAANATANTFSNVELYIPNYAGSTNKSISADGVGEINSANGAVAGLTAALSTVTSAISQIDIFGDGTGNFVQYSTAYLYGIKNS